MIENANVRETNRPSAYKTNRTEQLAITFTYASGFVYLSLKNDGGGALQSGFSPTPSLALAC